MKITADMLNDIPHIVTNNGEIRICCAECGDEEYKLYINLTKKVWNCFKGAHSGKVEQEWEPDLSKFKAHYEDYTKAEVFEIDRVLKTNKYKVVKSLPRNVPLVESSRAVDAIKYLRERGVSHEEFFDYDIRICTEKHGPYRETIIFPIRRDPSTYPYKATALLDYFVCRNYKGSEPKYINAPWAKEDTLFVTKYYGPYVICEGIFDALAIARAGHSAIALLGKIATEHQLDRIKKEFPGPKLICLDHDAFTYSVALAVSLINSNKEPVQIVGRIETDPADLARRNLSELKRILNDAYKELKKQQM